MTRALNTNSYVHILFFSLIICNAIRVNAQQSLIQRATDNFTSFTAERLYPDIVKLNALTSVEYHNNPDFGKCLNDSAQWYEQIDKRTLKTRTYKGPGNEIIIENGYGNLNYVDTNGWMRFVNTNLKPTENGWSAQQQEIPVYLYYNATTSLSLGSNKVMTFNKNVQFDQINQTTLSTADYTVGDNGMYIKNVAPNTDKIIRFGRGRIETDYRIKQPLKLNGDLVISEDVVLPTGYTISENVNYNPETGNLGVLVVKAADGKIVAELRAPLCYDIGGKTITGNYQLKKQDDGYRLELEIPSAWINDPLRQYPITIDPEVNGPLSKYSGGIIGSCVYPNFDTASIAIAIPAKVTITNFYAEGEFYTPVLPIKYGYLSFQTSCLPGMLVYPGDSALPASGRDSAGWDYIPLGINDLTLYGATCCYQPSCLPDTFRLIMGIARDTIDTAGCNARYIYYDPSNTDGSPFEAYIIGHTAEASYNVPASVCSNQCTFDLNINADYGVPPYIISHSWNDTSVSTGNYNTGVCTSEGSAKLTLTIPVCRGASCTDSTLTVPPPIIIDACNDTVKQLFPTTITLAATPNVSAMPDTQTICSGTNVNITLSSCLSNATYTWISSEGPSGSGSPVTNSPSNSSTNPIKVTYMITAFANGCAGNSTAFPVTVTPFTININPVNPVICEGNSTGLTASGEATSYKWLPAEGLNCIVCSSPTANPTTTTTYVVSGTSSGDCSAQDTVVVVVNPTPELTVSNDTTIFVGDSAHLFANSSYAVIWSPSAGLSCANCDNAVAAPAVTTTYMATVTEGTCSASRDVIVRIIQPCEAVHVPSAFTPDAAINNYLHVLNYGKVSLQEFRVYNRWGQMVYQTNNINDPGWNGTYNGKSEPVGMYVYYAVVSCQGQAITVRGDVTLLR